MKALLLTLTILFCCSCTTIYWQKGDGQQEMPQIPDQVWRHEFFFGFWESQAALPLEELCPTDANFEMIRVRRAPAQILVGVLTLGIYTPNSVSAVCSRDL